MTNKCPCRLIDDAILAPMGLDPRIGQSTRGAKIELFAAAGDAWLKAEHDEFGDFGRVPNLDLTPMRPDPAIALAIVVTAMERRAEDTRPGHSGLSENFTLRTRSGHALTGPPKVRSNADRRAG